MSASAIAFGVHLLTRFQNDPPAEGQTLEEYAAETLAWTLDLSRAFNKKAGGGTETCRGVTKKGRACKRAGSNDGFCKAHIPDPPAAAEEPLVVPPAAEPEPEESQSLTPQDAQGSDDDDGATEPEPVRVLCKGKGKKGPCKSRPLKGKEFCRRHEGAEPLPNPVAAATVWTRCEAGECSDPAGDDSEFCAAHSAPPPKPVSRTIMPEEVSDNDEPSEEDILGEILGEFQ